MVPVSSTLEVLSKERCALYETHVSSLAWNAINLKDFFSPTLTYMHKCVLHGKPVILIRMMDPLLSIILAEIDELM